MLDDQFKRLLGNLSLLSVEQLDTVLLKTQYCRYRSHGVQALEASLDGLGCAHCKAKNTVKNGHSRGLQRYRCVTCGRSFNAAANAPLSRLRNKERFFQVGECRTKGLTLKECAAALDIAEPAAFQLRHRFPKAVVDHQPIRLMGLVEVDETYFRDSQKGSRKLVTRGTKDTPREARKRADKPKESTKLGKPASRKELVPVLVGRLRGQAHVTNHVLQAMNKAQATDALKAWMGPETLLCTDGSGTLRQATARCRVKACSRELRQPSQWPDLSRPIREPISRSAEDLD